MLNAIVGAVFSGIALVGAIVVLILLSEQMGYRPHSECHTVPPYGQHDVACIYFVGR